MIHILNWSWETLFIIHQNNKCIGFFNSLYRSYCNSLDDLCSRAVRPTCVCVIWSVSSSHGDVQMKIADNHLTSKVIKIGPMIVTHPALLLVGFETLIKYKTRLSRTVPFLAAEFRVIMTASNFSSWGNYTRKIAQSD